MTALEARVDDIKLDFVQQALMHEEQKLKGQSAHPKGMLSGRQEDSALMGRFKRAPRLQNQKCYHCGQPGHFRRDCPKRRQQDNGKAVHKARAAGEKHPNPDSESADEGVFAASVGSAGLLQMGRWLIDNRFWCFQSHDIRKETSD